MTTELFPKAIATGKFHGVDCYVLEDEAGLPYKQRVVSTSSLEACLDRERNDRQFGVLVRYLSRNFKKLTEAGIRKFQPPEGDAPIDGLGVTYMHGLLVAIDESEHEGPAALPVAPDEATRKCLASQARQQLRALAELGLTSLADEVTGFQ